MKKCFIIITLVFSMAQVSPAADVATSDGGYDIIVGWAMSYQSGLNPWVGVRITEIDDKSVKTYLKFDLSSVVDANDLAGAELEIVLAEDPNLAAGSSTLRFYGLDPGHDGEEWTYDDNLYWSNAPGNDTTSGTAMLSDETTLLGTVVVAQSAGNGDVITFSDASLLAFLLATFGDNMATIIVTTEGPFDNYVTFASKENEDYDPPTLKFRTATEPTLVAVLSPNGGENINGKSSYEITWNIEGPKDEMMDIEYSLDDGGQWTLVDTVDPSVVSSYQWTVPDAETDQALVRLCCGTICDESDDVFTIVECSPADIDGSYDCEVNLKDFAVFASQWLESYQP